MPLRALVFPLLLSCGLLGGACRGPAPTLAPQSEATRPAVPPPYPAAYTQLLTHPAVQAFGAEHIPPSEPMGVEVAPEVVPLDYALLLPGVLGRDYRGRADSAAVAQARLDAWAAADATTRASDPALPSLSRGLRRPLTAFFGRPVPHGEGWRLSAQLYPNPYRREGFEAVRAGTPGLAVLLVLDRAGAVTSSYAAPIPAQ